MWMGKAKHTRISLKNTISASTRWKLYPVKADGVWDLNVRGQEDR
jgi:hypothetical protein